MEREIYLDKEEELPRIIQERVIERYQCLFMATDSESIKNQEEVIRQEARQVIGRNDKELEDFILDYLLGYKELGPFFRDPKVSDIMVNGFDQVYIERENCTIRTDIKFSDNDEVMRILQNAVQRSGRKIDYSNPLVDVRLPDGSRLNAIILPNCPFPSISIRKFNRNHFTIRELETQGFLNSEMAVFFEYAVKSGCNIVIAASTGAGKTTFLKTLCDFIPKEERIITIEDTYELNIDGHVVPLQKSERVNISQLMINALRMYPKRIILGEFRGSETAELLQAMGTGHMGSMTTGHANNGRQDLLQRLVRAMLNTGMSEDELTRHIACSIDLTVFIKKYKDGNRCITEVNEIIDDKGKPKFAEIFHYDRINERHDCLNSLSLNLLNRMQDELGKITLPPIKAFSKLDVLKDVVM
ncbi:MAG: CpaF family protein [Peptococcaceae bacterium]|nr:CpaF family protein [Peptococcaceae bacterium]